MSKVVTDSMMDKRDDDDNRMILMMISTISLTFKDYVVDDRIPTKFQSRKTQQGRRNKNLHRNLAL